MCSYNLINKNNVFEQLSTFSLHPNPLSNKIIKWSNHVLIRSAIQEVLIIRHVSSKITLHVKFLFKKAISDTKYPT